MRSLTAGRDTRPAGVRSLASALRSFVAPCAAAARDNGAVHRPAASSIPDTPGSYQFKDAHGRVLYVGKASNLRSRLSSYFAAPETLMPRTRQMVAAADSVEWIEVRNEVEALFLEFNLIQAHKPRFNVRYKDDKSYPYLAVTLDEEWPRAMVLRGAKRKGVRYFGPYAHAYAIRETLDLLLRTFAIRTCTKPKFDRHHRLGRPCLYAHIEKCAAPCVGDIDREAYDVLVNELLGFLDGDHVPVLERLEKGMHEAAEALEFERAARLRDQITSVRKAIERQQMVAPKEEDFDAIALAEDPLEAAVQMFLVRRGRVVGRKGLIVDKVEDLDTPALVGRLLEQVYAGAPPEDIPREVLVPVLPDDAALYEAFLTEVRGAKVGLRVPRRGAKRELLTTVTRNAEEAFTQHRLRRASDHNARARALTSLQEALDLPDAPLRIECFDISNLQGTEIVGSMVVMEDGLAKRSDYRHFKVRSQEGQDDFAAMEEVLTRRFQRYLEEREEGARRGRRFAYPPNLLLVDGGRGQLNVATRVLEELGLEDLPAAALAKRFEEVYLPSAEDPVRIPRDSEALFLLQQVRDEAHRFAVTYHRKLRAKKATRSVLDDVPGLGPTRRSRLLREFGSVKQLRAAERDTLLALPWLPDAVGRAVHDKLHGREGS
ncbi:MAG: excinuclease ABC subunit UvrC [Actinobacteria bacterium]|nr:excinuclease ABC subunit UvrC [Actinomycetota bacterium]